MKKFGILFLLLTSQAFALTNATNVTSFKPALGFPNDVEKKLNLSATAGPAVAIGTQVTQKKVQVLKAVWDVAVVGGASIGLGGGFVSSIPLKDYNGGYAVLPVGAIVKLVLIDTITAFSGGTGGVGSSAQLSIGVNDVGDLRGTLGIASLHGLISGTPVATSATMLKVSTLPKTIFGQVTVDTVTAGKLNVFIEYYLSN